MDTKSKRKIKAIFYPLYYVYKRIMKKIYLRNAMAKMDKKYFSLFNRHINWEKPTEYNEIVNWLKFHEDMQKWARLADKYAVREYIRKCGLDEILIPLYGVYNSVDDLFRDWDRLPNEFVIKSNNGCGHVVVIAKENGGKKAVDKKELSSELKYWLKEADYGLHNAEFQYLYIKNCIMIEQLLVDSAIVQFSSAPIDYKIYCLNGNPYICYVSYGRTLTATGSHKRTGDLYDLEWNERSDLMALKEKRLKLPRPQNWERMLEIAKILSKGHPQARIDLYNINGKIYFGEITLTNGSGFDTEFKNELFMDMGSIIKLDLSMAKNQFADK